MLMLVDTEEVTIVDTPEEEEVEEVQEAEEVDESPEEDDSEQGGD